MHKDVNGKAGIGVLVVVVIMLIVATALVLPSTFSKYVLSSEQTLNVVVSPREEIVVDAGIYWILDALETGSTASTSIAGYWTKARLTSNTSGTNKTTLDSTGPNFGIYVASALAEEYTGSSQVNFAFTMFVRKETVVEESGSVDSYYMNVLFINKSIDSLSANTLLHNVTHYEAKIVGGIKDNGRVVLDRDTSTVEIVSVTVLSKKLKSETLNKDVMMNYMYYRSIVPEVIEGGEQ